MVRPDLQQFAKLFEPARRSGRVARAFTLIELLTVMAISAILMGLIIIPLVQSFNMTRTAQAFADAQDRARILTERMALEIGGAVSVRSNSGLVTAVVNGVDRKISESALIMELPGRTGGIVEAVAPFTKIDIVMPAEGDPGATINGAYIDPNSGVGDPTLGAPKGQVSVPVAPGMTMVRYFVAKRDPFRDYNNPYDGLLMARNGQQDNLYVLYRAEVQPLLAGGGVNGNLFDTDANNRPVLDDPRFMIPNRNGSGQIITNDAKADRIRNWLASGTGMGHSVIMTEVSRYDMIQSVFDLRTREVAYDGNVPRVVPLIQFAPGHVSNDPAKGQVAARPGEETDNSAALAPDVYTASFGLWDRAIIRNWPKGWNPNDANLNAYNVLRGDITSGDGPGFPEGVSIYVYDPDIAPLDIDSGTEVFDVTRYERAASTPGSRYPFSQAANAADSRSNWFGSATARATFVPYTFNSSKGKVLASFNISEVGDPTVAPPSDNLRNLPSKGTSGAGGPTTPLTDPDTTGAFYLAKHDPLNEKFNVVWNQFPNLQPKVHRYIDLRVTTNEDGSISPLHPSFGFARANIVPGSEEVYGPDQLPGPHYGAPMRYTRVTREPGPNQYRLNYVDQPEPTNGGGAIDYSSIGLTPAQTAGFNPNVYDPQNFVSAVVQPRFKKGYLQLNSDPNVPLPQGEILVAYRFQFNGAGNNGGGSREDVFAVDYDTRQLVNVLLTIRNYPQSTLPNPQTVTLKSTATVRNYIR